MISKFLKQILLLINYLLIVALVLAYAAGYVSPNRLPFLAVFALGFPYLVFLNVAFVIFWSFLKKTYLLYSFLVLLLGAVPINNYFNVWPQNQKHEGFSASKSFSVLTYNVRVFDLYNWSKNKNTRNQIFQFVRSKHPDIACFQEYFNQKGNYFPVHDSLIKNQHFTDFHIYYYKELLVNQHQFGIATYSRYPIINKQTLKFENSYNCAIYSDIKIGLDTVRVFNLHLQSFRLTPVDYQFIDSLSTMSEEQRMQGALGVYERMRIANNKRAIQAEYIKQKISESPYPVMVCGDFNATPASYSYQVLSKDLYDSHLKKGYGIGGTFPRFIPSFRIDYLLYSPVIYCKNYTIYKNELSDHYPVMGFYNLAGDALEKQ